MSGDVVIRVENIFKEYRLGQVGSRTLAQDVNRWWCRLRGKEDPDLVLGEDNVQDAAGNTDYVWALKDINFEVKQGDVYGIIGKNGAGKSTLLKILSRITAPTTGRVKVKGRIASLLEVGTGFHPELTGRENIFLNGAIMGMTRAETAAKIDEIVDFSGCNRYIDTPTKRFSSGMKVRLGFAVAAHLEPEILIVDEVLAVGDLAFQKRCLGKMKNVASEGRTVLFVSHNMASIKALCPDAMLLDNGQLSATGPSTDIVELYKKLNYQELPSGLDTSREPGWLYTEPADRNGGFAITGIQMLNEKGQAKNRLSTWDYVRLRIHYRTPDSVPNGSVYFKISTQDDVVLMQASTQPDRTVSLPFKPGTSYADCIFPQFPLAAGTFRFSGGLAVPRQHIFFYEENLCSLLIHESDVFQSGTPPSDKRMLLVAPHTWETPAGGD